MRHWRNFCGSFRAQWRFHCVECGSVFRPPLVSQFSNELQVKVSKFCLCRRIDDEEDNDDDARDPVICLPPSFHCCNPPTTTTTPPTTFHQFHHLTHFQSVSPNFARLLLVLHRVCVRIKNAFIPVHSRPRLTSRYLMRWSVLLASRFQPFCDSITGPCYTSHPSHPSCGFTLFLPSAMQEMFRGVSISYQAIQIRLGHVIDVLHVRWYKLDF